MAVSRSYIVRDAAGQETGPFDQDALIKLAENGTITAFHEVRSTLIPQWGKAGDLPFLKKLLKKQMDQIYNPDPTFFQKMKEKAGRRCDISLLLADNKTAKPSRAKMTLRFLAALTDLIVLLLLFILTAVLVFFAVKAKALSPAAAGGDMIALWAVVYFLYYILSISCFTQTFGQKAWGIFLMRGEDDLPFYAGRIFFYALFLPFFALLTPLTMKTTPSGRSWQEVFSGLTMVKVKFNKQSN